MSDLTPVQALQREIENSTDCFMHPKTNARYIAALEVAKAMCEVPPHLLNLEARLKLAELLKALQR